MQIFLSHYCNYCINFQVLPEQQLEQEEKQEDLTS